MPSLKPGSQNESARALGFRGWIGACCPCTTLGPARDGCWRWGAEGTSGTSRGGSRVRPQLQRCRGVRLCGTALGGVN